MAGESATGGSNYRGQSIDLYINSSCNLTCSSCFLGDHYFSTGQFMTVAGASSIMRWAVNQGVDDVAFLGGEPTLHPQLATILTVARDLGIRTNRLVSNGTAPFRRLIQGSHGHLIDRVHLSLDGATAAVNDTVRGTGAFDNVVRAIRLTAQFEIPTIINHTVNRSNLKHIHDMIEFAENTDCEVLNIHWLSAMGRATNGALSVTPDEWTEVCNIVARHTPRRSGFAVECQAAFVSVTQRHQWATSVNENACSVRSFENLQFMPDGRVYICGLLVDIPDINTFTWSGSELIPSSAYRTERTICADYHGPGCPARLTMSRDLRYDKDRFVPVCIYERIENKRG